MSWKKYGVRNRVLESMGFATYADYLASNVWKQLRARKLSETPNCELCHQKAYFIHHASYGRKVLKGERTDGLVSICEPCHKFLEFDNQGGKETVSVAGLKLLWMLTRQKQYKRAKELARAMGWGYSSKSYSGTFRRVLNLAQQRGVRL